MLRVNIKNSTFIANTLIAQADVHRMAPMKQRLLDDKNRIPMDSTGKAERMIAT